VSVLKAAGEWEILAVNELDDECFATPADCRWASLHSHSQCVVLFWQIVRLNSRVRID